MVYHGRHLIREEVINIKPIETRYRNYRFRSRLEARWAVFFDSLDILWSYEMQGFELPDGTWYLPDFHIPHLGLWLEIKPNLTGSRDEWPDHPVFEIAGKIANGNRVGSPEFEHFASNFALICGEPYYDVETEMFDYNGVVFGDDRYRWCECPYCGMVGLEYDGRSDRLPCKLSNDVEKPGCPSSQHGDKGYNYDTPRLSRAYGAARSARFDGRG